MIGCQAPVTRNNPLLDKFHQKSTNTGCIYSGVNNSGAHLYSSPRSTAQPAARGQHSVCLANANKNLIFDYFTYSVLRVKFNFKQLHYQFTNGH